MPQVLSRIVHSATPVVPATYHWYITVGHPEKGEHGFYLDTVSDRFADVMDATKLHMYGHFLKIK
jgi:hypothetical protein